MLWESQRKLWVCALFSPYASLWAERNYLVSRLSTTLSCQKIQGYLFLESPSPSFLRPWRPFLGSPWAQVFIFVYYVTLPFKKGWVFPPLVSLKISTQTSLQLFILIISRRNWEMVESKTSGDSHTAKGTRISGFSTQLMYLGLIIPCVPYFIDFPDQILFYSLSHQPLSLECAV